MNIMIWLFPLTASSKQQLNVYQDDALTVRKCRTKNIVKCCTENIFRTISCVYRAYSSKNQYWFSRKLTTVQPEQWHSSCRVSSQKGITGFPAPIPAREPSFDGLAGVFTKRTVVWPSWGLGHGQQIKGVSFLIKFELMTSYLIGFK